MYLKSFVFSILFVTSYCEDVSDVPSDGSIELEGLSTDQVLSMKKSAESHTFQTEVSRVMKLIINSLYRNKEIFLRELISNASDAIDKIRVLSLTDKSILGDQPTFKIEIKCDDERHTLSITDTGIGMTKADLVNNLGTIAKSGTAEFLNNFEEATSSDTKQMSDLIGQFGVGFYSAFLVADKVIVTSKHNDDDQHIWESDSSSFSVVKDPRGNTLQRGTSVTLVLKKEAYDYLSQDTLEGLIKKYSQFINFDISLWHHREEEEEVEEEEDVEKTETSEDDQTIEEDKVEKEQDEIDEEAGVEDDKEQETKTPSKKKTVTKKVYDWLTLNKNKPIWTRKAEDITEDEYKSFYSAISKDESAPLAHTHFVAEGEVTFKAILYVPQHLQSENFHNYGTRTDNIKLYVKRVFITDDFNDMLPNYLSFLKGLIDSDDLPLNVSRETLQQHKLLKVIKKKLVRKALDMFKKMDDEKFKSFWKEYSTNIKLGVLEDSANRSRLSKLLRFLSSNGELTSLAQYVERMKDKQDHIYFMAGSSKAEVESSPFVEKLLKKGYEVLYLIEAVDEYTISAIPEFEGKKFQNVAKEGLSLSNSESKRQKMKDLKEKFEPLTKWMAESALKEHILKAEISERLDKSPCAIITSKFGWTANMQRLVASQTHSKAEDMQRDYYLSQKKALEINPRHPLIKELLRRVVDVSGDDETVDQTAEDMAKLMFDTAVLRSGYMLKNTQDFAEKIEKMMKSSLGVDKDEPIEEEEEEEEDEVEGEVKENEDDDDPKENDGDETIDIEEDIKDEL